jgi:hypothetical protein
MRNKLVSAIVSGCCGLLIVCGTLPLPAQNKQPPIVLNIKPPHVKMRRLFRLILPNVLDGRRSLQKRATKLPEGTTSEPADEADRGRHPCFARHVGFAGGPGSLSLSLGGAHYFAKQRGCCQPQQI